MNPEYLQCITHNVQYIVKKKLVDIHRSRKIVIYFQGGKKKQSIETDPKMTQILKLADKDFKAASTNTFKDLKEHDQNN